MPRTAPLCGYASYRPAIGRQIAAGAFKPALAALAELQRNLPPDPTMWDDLATCYWALGDAATAIKLAELAARQLGTNADAWGKLGAMALSMGDIVRARDAFETALRHRPRDANALAALCRITPFARASPRSATLRKIAGARDAPRDARVTACHALGRIEHAAGRIPAAFRHFHRANALAPGQYDAAAVTARVEALCAECPAPVEDGTDPATPRLVFVCGLPRSGTTLVESILTRHPDVGTAGESDALARTARAARTAGATAAGVDPARLRALYLDRQMARRTGPFPPVLIDKTPLNLFELGLVPRLFPGARVIVLSRHPLDTGLSNFTTNFHASHPFSHGLDTIAHLTRAAHRAAAHHADTLGAAIRTQSFRALVQDPARQVRALLDHVGLDWCAACLHPEDREGAIGTASLTQVRAPISTGALDKWRRYAPHLQPLIDGLGGPAWIDAWERADARL